MKTNEKFIDAMKDINRVMKEDIKAGRQWKYTNTKKRNTSFAAARKAKNYVTNCVTGVDWALKIAGISGAALDWYGAPGKIVYVSSGAKEAVKKYFTIIDAKGKTVSQLYKNHELCEGDILTYVNLSHTNAYVGGKQSFDAGHAYCKGSGEGAPFTKWIGNLAHQTAKVKYILRIKDRAHWRVQTGAFSTKTALNKHLKELKAKKISYTTFEEEGMQKVQVGYFDGKENAEAKVAELKKLGFAAIIKEA